MTALSRKLAIPFFAYVVAGSLALVLWIRSEALRESRRRFVELAETNARFIREAQLPRSERTAEGLGRALALDVVIAGTDLERGPDHSAWPRAGEWQKLASGDEAAAAAINAGERLVLIRPAPPFSVLAEPARLLAALLGFWALSLGLAWLIGRRIVRPLRVLADKLPHIAEEGADTVLAETARNDEIGQLARAYVETRAQLASERQARVQAERLAALGKLAAGLAHEINNPVAAIRLHGQLLEEEIAGEPRERVRTILAESARIEGLVSQWMFLARPHPPQTSACDLADIVSAVANALRPAAEHAGVTIENGVQTGLAVNADRRRVSQAITNVFTNALQAAAGGKVFIGARRDTPGAVKLVFTDTGRGFSEEALQRGTELFYSEKEGGMGVGLSVAAEILRAHGGELHLANQPAGGAIVTLVLPAA